MKNYFFILVLFFCHFLFSQENIGIPPSPTVASLVTIENDLVNNSGAVAQNVPLHNILVGNHNFPIQLQYSSTGVLVEEIPT